jgi:hypothetical protein
MLLEEEGSSGLIILDFALQMAFCFVLFAGGLPSNELGVGMSVGFAWPVLEGALAFGCICVGSCLYPEFMSPRWDVEEMNMNMFYFEGFYGVGVGSCSVMKESGL